MLRYYYYLKHYNIISTYNEKNLHSKNLSKLDLRKKKKKIKYNTLRYLIIMNEAIF